MLSLLIWGLICILDVFLEGLFFIHMPEGFFCVCMCLGAFPDLLDLILSSVVWWAGIQSLVCKCKAISARLGAAKGCKFWHPCCMFSEEGQLCTLLIRKSGLSSMSPVKKSSKCWSSLNHLFAKWIWIFDIKYMCCINTVKGYIKVEIDSHATLVGCYWLYTSYANS